MFRALSNNKSVSEKVTEDLPLRVEDLTFTNGLTQLRGRLDQFNRRLALLFNRIELFRRHRKGRLRHDRALFRGQNTLNGTVDGWHGNTGGNKSELLKQFPRSLTNFLSAGRR